MKIQLQKHLLVPCLQLLFNTAFNTGSVPQSWKTSLVTPIFKKGDTTDTADYRPIAVGEPFSRLYASIFLQDVIDKHRRLKTPLYLCFEDLKSAYD